MSNSSEQQQQLVLLHGDLELTIHEARDLPNMDTWSSFLRRLCVCPRGETRSSSRSVPGHGGDAHNNNNRRRFRQTSDPYVAVVVPWGKDSEHQYATLARTHVVRNSEAPVWEASVLLPLAHSTSKLDFMVKDADPLGADHIGTASIPAADIIASAETPIKSLWFPIFCPDNDGRTPKPETAVRISATFIPAAAMTASLWRSVDGQDPAGVPAYFPLRKGCELKLYQDAHVAPDEIVGVPGVFEQGRCWEDMCMAVLDARHLVYVVGWSVDAKVKLLRQRPVEMPPEIEAKVAEVERSTGRKVEDMSLGDLLKHKSKEPGVRVRLLLWDDRTSNDIPCVPACLKGVMGTHDEKTKKFFEGSLVTCVLCPRYPSNKLSVVKQKVTKASYTHHQKCLLVDTPAPASDTDSMRRRITAFLGGLDLCDGRYDTPTHKLFQDLDTVFHGDIRNPTFQAEAKRWGPRQPWHDMHCRLDGPAAYDVLENLRQRWSKLDKEGDQLNLIPGISSGAGSGGDDDGDGSWGESWHAQVLRSVDSGSVKGFPSSLLDTDAVRKSHLLCKKNVEVDNSIHVAYVKAIRSAKRFIYIENQYFIGSSYAWPSRHRGASNLVPMEIALKVAAKIRAGEAFAVYIVIPMWPEGKPSSEPAQEILYWQNQTMKTMYGIIAEEIKRKGLEDVHPQQYLNFYCLGNREEEVAAARPGTTSIHHQGRGSTVLGYLLPRCTESVSATLARSYRRFMVYVHSKGMIVDDEYVLIGSANINQRSLAGCRDTEIAVGAYQPRHTTTDDEKPRGKVYGYRMALWEEHLGREAMSRWHSELERPESPGCVELVNNIASDNWNRYAADNDTAARPRLLQGHLMRYPVDVRKDGSVKALKGHKEFPDVGGRVLGSRKKLPDNLTM